MSRRLSITINDSTLDLVDAVLTPSGFMQPPKGSYSALVEQLLHKYLEETFGADIITISEAAQAVGLDETKIKTFLAKRG